VTSAVVALPPASSRRGGVTAENFEGEGEMPVYDYLCGSCGAFTAVRPMAEYEAPCDCPDCGTAAPRVMLTAPHFSCVPAGRRQAGAVNERSAAAPKSVAEFKAERHGAGCSCCGGNLGRKRRTLLRPDGGKSFPSARPWMISH
jgi:putative FmdB family regulatory protein